MPDVGDRFPFIPQCVIEWLARLGQVERMAPELSYFGRSDAEDWPSFRTMLNGTCTSQWEVADALYRQSWNK